MEEIFLDDSQHLLIRSKYLLPLPQSPLLDGAIEIKNSRVHSLGPYKTLKKEVSRAKLIDLEDHVLMPVLTNAHLHLELSALRFRIPPAGSFLLWVRQVIKKRAALTPLEMKEAANFAINEILREGIGIIGEVTNSALTVEVLLRSPLCGYIFQEIINFKGSSPLKDLKDFSPHFKLTYSAHAPYTVSPLLIQVIKAYNRKKGRLFVIHLGESSEEVEFLKKGEGQVAELLRERGQWNDSFKAPGVSPVRYLESLGCLDEKTLIIHGIHLTEDDLEVLARCGVKVCLCPRSNLYTGAGFPNLPKMLAYGLEICLGTDSLASNDRLSIFEEIKALHSFYPEVPPLKLLEMASINGARILGFEERGTLKPGAWANFLAVATSSTLSDSMDKALEEFLTCEKEVKYRFYAGL